MHSIIEDIPLTNKSMILASKTIVNTNEFLREATTQFHNLRMAKAKEISCDECGDTGTVTNTYDRYDGEHVEETISCLCQVEIDHEWADSDNDRV